jgi:hypothetical protein
LALSAAARLLWVEDLIHGTTERNRNAARMTRCTTPWNRGATGAERDDGHEQSQTEKHCLLGGKPERKRLFENDGHSSDRWHGQPDARQG